jgi:hypothetical protein
VSKFAWRPRGKRTPIETPHQRRTSVTSVIGLAAVLFLGALIVGLHVRDDTKLSPIDETQHVDYLDKAAHLHIPRQGGLDGAVARHEAACRGVEAPGSPPPCAQAATAPNAAFQENAIDTAGADPPLYYFTTGVAARAMQAVFGIRSLVTAARLLGFVWLAAAVILLWLAMGELEIGLVARTAVSALLVTTPAVVLSHVTVTNDATLLLAGAAALYAALRWERRALPGWVLLVIAALCAFSKILGLPAVAGLSVYLFIRWIRTRRAAAPPMRTPSELLKMAVAVPAAGLAVALVWQVVVIARTIPGAPTSVSIGFLHADHLSLGQILVQVPAILSPIHDTFIMAPLLDTRTFAIIAGFNALIIAATFGGTAFSAPGSKLEAIAGSASILMVASGPLFAVFIYVDAHAAFGIPGRYGLSLMPFAAVALAAALTKASVRFAVCAFAIAAAVFTVVHLAQYHVA